MFSALIGTNWFSAKESQGEPRYNTFLNSKPACKASSRTGRALRCES